MTYRQTRESKFDLYNNHSIFKQTQKWSIYCNYYKKDRCPIGKRLNSLDKYLLSRFATMKHLLFLTKMFIFWQKCLFLYKPFLTEHNQIRFFEVSNIAATIHLESTHAAFEPIRHSLLCSRSCFKTRSQCTIIARNGNTSELECYIHTKRKSNSRLGANTVVCQ